jgi:hypothetical protein
MKVSEDYRVYKLGPKNFEVCVCPTKRILARERLFGRSPAILKEDMDNLTSAVKLVLNTFKGSKVVDVYKIKNGET